MEKIEKDSFPLISIVTVVYNGAATIEQTIRSVVEQSYPNKEYIIIDGGSTDGTLDIIKKYTHQIDYFKSEADEGIFDAMNKGIKIAKGEIIGIINADDWYEKDIFSTVAEICQNLGKPLVIHGLLRNFLEDQFYSIKGNSTRVLKYDMIQHPTCFISKELYRNLGVYDTRYKYSADYDLILRFLNKGVEFHFVEKVIANFRMGGISSQSKAQGEKYHILKRHQVISRMEASIRLVLLSCSNRIKSLL